MDILEAIYERRAVRRYGSREVDAASIQKLLQAAVQAPSTLNQQPWVFGVFHGRKRLQAYSVQAKDYLMRTFPTTIELYMRTQEFYSRPDYDVFLGAGTLVVIYATRGRMNPAEDCCLAAQNLMLAACGLGLATCPIGFVRPWLQLAETKRELGVPEHYTAVFPVVVGYAEGATEPVPRREPEIASWKWDEVENAK